MKALKNIKILYIEDEDFIRKNAVEYLRFYSEYVYEARNGKEGFKKYEEVKPDIIICDIIMPELNGLELIKKIRQNDTSTQVIIATARIDKEFLLKAVELKLVKYLQKPISEEKLLLALQESIVLMQQEGAYLVTFSKSCQFDVLNKTLIQNNTLIKLSKKEALFLELCAKNKSRVVGYKEFEDYVWEGYMTENAMRSTVKDLRKKLPAGSLENISGVGYKLNSL